MGAAFDDLAFVHDQDLVGAGGLVEAVGYYEGGALVGDFIGGVFECSGAGGACFCGGFVHDDDGGVQE